jgi:hypothetical protein
MLRTDEKFNITNPLAEQAKESMIPTFSKLRINVSL